jgi:hypothetical protein
MLLNTNIEHEEKIHEDDDDEENYTAITTLRKSSAFTIERFSSKFYNISNFLEIYHDEVFYVLHGHLENSLIS